MRNPRPDSARKKNSFRRDQTAKFFDFSRLLLPLLVRIAFQERMRTGFLLILLSEKKRERKNLENVALRRFQFAVKSPTLKRHY